MATPIEFAGENERTGEQKDRQQVERFEGAPGESERNTKVWHDERSREKQICDRGEENFTPIECQFPPLLDNEPRTNFIVKRNNFHLV